MGMAVKVIVVRLLKYLIQRYAAELVFDVVIEKLERLAEKTSTKTDNEVLAKIKSDKQELLAALKGRA
jgi:uncharacterized membrane-anchored protein YitT (DUF2179 family)